MRIEQQQIEGNLVLEDGLALYGQVTGDIVVTDKGDLHLYGMCARDLTVQDGGKAIVYGMVGGHVVNNGGELKVLGTVVGSLRSLAGDTDIDPNASVLGELA